MSRSRGRFRKRIVRKINDSNGQTEVHSEVGDPKSKPVLEQLLLCKQTLGQMQRQYLQNYQDDLAQCASRLGIPGCWHYYYSKLGEARKVGVETKFREMVVTYATKFCRALAKT